MEESQMNAALAKIKELEQTQEKEPVEKEPDKICPHCFYNISTGELHINEADVKEFHRCIMGFRPFSKMFSLWNGDLRIYMTALDASDTDRLNRKIRAMSFESDELLENGIKLKLLFMCRKIETLENEITNVPPADAEIDDLDIGAKFKEIFNVPETIIRILARTYTEFELIVDALNNGGFDENFFKGGGTV